MLEILELPTVKIFAAGDHNHTEATDEQIELVQMLLEKSGYTKKGIVWECRIDKLLHCNHETRPIRVIGWKVYGVILRVKPSVYSTADHQMTLQIPSGSGYSAENLFNQLRGVEKSVSRAFREGERIKPVKTTLPPVTPQKIVLPIAVPQVTPVKTTLPAVTQPKMEANPVPQLIEPVKIEIARPQFVDLKYILKSHDKLLYVMTKVNEVIDSGFCHNKKQFIESLRSECRWDRINFLDVAISRVLRELVKNGFLTEILGYDDKTVGYRLTTKGGNLINRRQPIVETTKIEVIKKVEKQYDVAGSLCKIRDKLQELANVANRINSNNLEKAELMKKIAIIDQENEQLSKVLPYKEAEDVLGRLEHMITPLLGTKQ
jgi:DNA-binding MarR family transcriptional regulator